MRRPCRLNQRMRYRPGSSRKATTTEAMRPRMPPRRNGRCYGQPTLYGAGRFRRLVSIGALPARQISRESLPRYQSFSTGRFHGRFVHFVSPRPVAIRHERSRPRSIDLGAYAAKNSCPKFRLRCYGSIAFATSAQSISVTFRFKTAS